MNWFRNTIASLYDAVSAPVATTRDALSRHLGNIRSKVTDLYNKVRGHPPQKTLKDIVEEVAYDGVEDVRGLFDEGDAEHHDELVEDGDRVKAWRFENSLNSPLTRTVMAKITPHVDMRVVVVYSFSCDIYQGDGGVTKYHKSKSTKGSLSSLADIEAFIEQCEMQRLDIEDAEFWSKAYLPSERTVETPGAFEGKLIFDHVRIKILSTREPLLGCGPLPDWLRKKRCIYALDGTEERVDNLCLFRCLAVHNRGDRKQREKRTTREALNLAREYYENSKLKREDVRATKLVDMEGIARKFDLNIRIFEPKTNSEKAPWRLVYGQNQYRKGRRDDINLGMLGGHCFYIKKMDVLTQSWECEVCKQLFTREYHLRRHKAQECEGVKTTIICQGKKVKRIPSNSEKVFYDESFSYAACQWLEAMAEQTGRHIHHALCGHGGERVMRNSLGHELYKVDGYEPITKTVYEYNGCRWHGCLCRPDRTNVDKNRYVATKDKEKVIKELGYDLVTAWECEKPPKAKRYFRKEFRAYPHYIVFDFEALLQALNQQQTKDLLYVSKHVPVSVAIHDSLSKSPTFIEHEDPKILVGIFVEELDRRRVFIVEEVNRLHPRPEDFDMLSKMDQKAWNEWVDQVAVIGFNSGKYDINMIKRYFVERIAENFDEKIKVAKKDNNYMFLTTSKFKFLDIKNFLAPGMSYAKWCKSLGCGLEKLMFPYEWLTSYDKLSHVGPVEYENFYSSLSGKNTLSPAEYEEFRTEFHKRECVTMMDWLREYNLADVVPFIEAVNKTRNQYYDDEIDILKDAVSIPGVSMRYVLNKALKLNPKVELYSPGEPCKHKCEDSCFKKTCKACKEVQNSCTECTKNEAYELLQTGMVGGPAIVFCRYHERNVSGVRSHLYVSTQKPKTCKTILGYETNMLYLALPGIIGSIIAGVLNFLKKVVTAAAEYYERNVSGVRFHMYDAQKPETCKTILGYDANMLYPSTLMQDFPCGKEKLFKVPTPEAKHNLEVLTRGVQDGSLFGFAQVDIEVPEDLFEKFSEMSPLFVVQEIPNDQIPEHMHEYLRKTGRKRIPGTRKLCGLMGAKKILLYTPLLKWYLDHGLKVTAFHQFLRYKRGKPFAWFPEEVADARRQADEDPDKRIMGDTAKLKANSFYGKMIEDVARHANTTFTCSEQKVDQAMRSPYLEDLEEIGAAYEIREGKQKVKVDRAYQCGIAVYQLAKLRMLEFYYDFLDKYVDRRNFEYCYTDTDSAYFAISGEELRDVVRPELIEEYDKDVANWLVTDEYSARTGGLFKPEFVGSRMIALTAKCYFVEGKSGTKYSCKGMSKKQNEMTWQRYMAALNGELDTGKNTGFRVHEKGMVTYEQNKLGLSAYYDKRCVLEDGIHTRPL